MAALRLPDCAHNRSDVRTTAWTMELPVGRSYYRKFQHSTEWTTELPSGWVYYPMNDCTTGWTTVLPDGRPHYWVDDCPIVWPTALPGGQPNFRVDEYITGWTSVLPDGRPYYRMTMIEADDQTTGCPSSAAWFPPARWLRADDARIFGGCIFPGRIGRTESCRRLAGSPAGFPGRITNTFAWGGLKKWHKK